jgi:hypothetical protein
MYKVISDRKVCGKKKGDTLTEKEILENGGDAQHLLKSGHIKAEKSESTPSITKEGAAK